MPHLTAVPLPQEQVICRELADGDAVLLHLASGQYHSVNATGLAIYQLVDGQRSAAAISTDLGACFADAPQGLSGLVVDFLAALDERGLVVFPGQR